MELIYTKKYATMEVKQDVDDHTENYHIGGKTGYSDVIIEFLHGSHTDEVRITYLDIYGEEFTHEALLITGNNRVVADMIDYFSYIVEAGGGVHTHEDVRFKYSMGTESNY